MTARSSEPVREIARRLLPVNRGSWVLDRARTSLEQRTARLGADETSSLDPAQLWADTGDRGRGRHAHGFTFLADWVGAAAHATPQEGAPFRELVHTTVTAWDERFGSTRDTAPEMAYHDETTAQRLLGVVAALDMLHLDPIQRADLADFAARTAAILAEPGFHSGLNNHGMFQDMALLAWSILVADAEDAAGDHAWQTAEARLLAYFQSCFTAEGVHVENTPTYHVMVARYLPILGGIYGLAGSASATLYESLQAGAERFAVHCTAPDGRYPPVSDTQRRPIDTDLNLRTFAGGEFEYAATRGARGRKPLERTAAFPVSGYAMTRSAWGDEAATFVHFGCAYNADYHKHSDELSVFLRSGGRDLLCEAGAYGYNWRDPFTKYAYSSAAHNTMLVDGAGLSRTESADVRATARQPLNRMLIERAEDDVLDASGATDRYPSRSWTRRLLVTHGETHADSRIVVRDEVRSDAGSANLRFLWHVGPGLRVLLRPRGAEVLDGDTKVMEIEIRTEADIELSVVEGVEEPQPQGWYHPAFGERVPAPVLTVDCWQQDVTIETVVRLGDFVWGTAQRGSLRPLADSGPSVPAWELPGDEAADRGVVLLLPGDEPDDRDRLSAELQKARIPLWVVPGARRETVDAPTPDMAVAAAERVAQAVSGVVRREHRRGRRVDIAAVGEAFAIGALAAFSTGARLIALDPALPAASSTHRERLTRALGEHAATGTRPAVRLVVTDAGRPAAQQAEQSLAPVRVEVQELRHLLAADAEDGFSDIVRNAIEAERGTEVRYLATYDRRKQCFVLQLLDLPDAVVAVRVFDGKNEVASMPYTAGATHRIPYEGRGPHRLRVHVRSSEGEEPLAFTTGGVRAR